MSYTISHSSGRLSSKLKIHDSFFVAKRKKRQISRQRRGKRRKRNVENTRATWIGSVPVDRLNKKRNENVANASAVQTVNGIGRRRAFLSRGISLTCRANTRQT